MTDVSLAAIVFGRHGPAPSAPNSERWNEAGRVTGLAEPLSTAPLPQSASGTVGSTGTAGQQGTVGSTGDVQTESKAHGHETMDSVSATDHKAQSKTSTLPVLSIPPAYSILPIDYKLADIDRPYAVRTAGSSLVWKCVAATDMGLRRAQEDCYVLLENVILMKPSVHIMGSFHLFAVLDGHGGKWAASFCTLNLLPVIVHYLEQGCTVKEAMTRAFTETDEVFRRASNSGTSGTTANVVLVENQTGRMWCANAGDTRAVHGRMTVKPTTFDYVPLSVDHKPDRPDERERIEKAKSFVIHGRLQGEIAVSRAIGDADMGASDGSSVRALIAEPEITESKMVAGDFVAIGSDGLYDAMSSEQVVKRIAFHLSSVSMPSLEAIAMLLVREALELGSRDNVTLVLFRWCL